MAIDGWEIASLASKLLLYLGTAGAVGGVFSLLLLHRHHRSLAAISRYTYSACVLGTVAVISGFFIQVGSFSGRGLAGMFDADIIGILRQTPVASMTLWRLLAFVLLIVGATGLFAGNKPLRWLARAIAAAGAVLLCTSFGQIGHLSDAGIPGQAPATLHTLAMALWMGSLFPLWHISRGTDLAAIRHSMIRFGQWAAGIVAVLILCGATMIYLLLDHPDQLLTSVYGRGLLLKLMMVCALLLLAAGNKWWLVPGLPRTQKSLTRSIQVEMVLGSTILLVTASITTLTGP